MKKTILALMVTLFCLSASAQVRVISNVSTPEDNETWAVSNFTDNMGVGYQLTDKVMVGIQKNGEDYDYIARYNFTNNIYFSAQMPQEEATENITMGVGFSVRVWNSLYLEPNYTSKDDEGSFNVGLSYKL
jgi:hypothetical protein